MENTVNERKEIRLNIEWHSLVNDLLVNLWLIVLSCLIGLMGVYIYGHTVHEPRYTSSATLVVGSQSVSKAGTTNLGAFSQIAMIYSNVFCQPAITDRAAEYLGQETFDGTVYAAAITDTNIFTVSVTSDNPEKSYYGLCAILETYPEVSSSVFSNAFAEVFTSPSIPKYPSNTLPSRTYIVAAAMCVFVTAAIIVYLSVKRDTVKSERDFKEKVGQKLLGTVTHESKVRSISDVGRILRKEKTALLISKSSASFRFTEDYHKIATKLEYERRTNNRQVFLVTSVTENEGKSTSVSNIAISLASRGNKVIVLDMDFKRPSIDKILESKVENGRDLAALCAGKITPSEVNIVSYRKSRLFLAINSGPHPDYVKWIGTEKVKAVVDAFRQKVDFILIDTFPLSVSSDVETITNMADCAILVVKTDRAYTADINDAVLSLTETGKFGGCILNNVYGDFSVFGQFGSDETGRSYGRYGRYGKYSRYSHYSGYDKYSRYNHYSGYGEYGKATISDELFVDDIARSQNGGEEQ